MDCVNGQPQCILRAEFLETKKVETRIFKTISTLDVCQGIIII